MWVGKRRSCFHLSQRPSKPISHRSPCKVEAWCCATLIAECRSVGTDHWHGNHSRCHYWWCRSLCPSRLQSHCWSHDTGLCWGKELWHKADDWVEWSFCKFKISSQIQDHLVWLCQIQPLDSRDFIIQFQLSGLGGWRLYSLQQGGPTHHRN